MQSPSSRDWKRSQSATEKGGGRVSLGVTDPGTLSSGLHSPPSPGSPGWTRGRQQEGVEVGEASLLILGEGTWPGPHESY